jgi:RNA polymerase sigma factor (sigma-70 family)
VEPTGRDDAQLVAAARTDEPEAFGPLAQRWFDRCYDLAWHVLHDRELAADVAQDALLTAWQQLDRLERPEAFGGWLLRITRNRALDVLRREVRSVPTDDATRLEPREDETVVIGDPVTSYVREQQHDLVWAAAAALGPRDATLLDLHLRHGLEPHELATELGVAPNAAHQALFRLRRRLGTAIRAWLLWRDGEPDCVVLRAELLAAGLERFGPELVRLVDRHATSCEDCTAERERVTAPASLFSVVPVVAAPLALRQVRFDRLAEAGVPVAATADPSAPVEPPDATELPGASDLLGAAAGGGGGARSRALLLTAVAGFAAAALLLGGWLLQGSGDGAPVAADAAADAATGDAPTASPAALPPLPELLGIIPPDASVASAPPRLVPEAPADAGAGDGSALADAVDPVPAPPSDEPSDVTSPGDQGADDPSGAPSTDDPSTDQPPTDEPSTGEPPEEEPDDPAEPPPAPTVHDLDVVVVGACADGTLQHQVRWSTTGAETVTLQVADGTPAAVPTSGERLACAPRGSTFTLTASGPGGTAARTATAG